MPAVFYQVTSLLSDQDTGTDRFISVTTLLAPSVFEIQEIQKKQIHYL